MMRIKYVKLITFLLIITNIFIFYYSWRYFITKNFGITDYNTISRSRIINDKFVLAKVGSSPPTAKAQSQLSSQKGNKIDRIQTTNKHIKKSITIIFRDFYHFDNDLKSSISSIVKLIPNIKIYIITDEMPYPPLDIFNSDNFSFNETLNGHAMNAVSRVKMLTLNYDVQKNVNSFVQHFQIKTKYILFMPDSVRINGRAAITKILTEINNYLNKNENKSEKKPAQYKTFIIPFVSSYQKLINNCCNIRLSPANWIIEYTVQNVTQPCDMYLRKNAILVETALMKEIPHSVSSPFPEFFYITTRLMNTKNIYLNVTLQDGKKLFLSYHSKARRKAQRKEEFKNLYKRLQIKQVIRRSHANRKETNVAINKKHLKSHKNNKSLNGENHLAVAVDVTTGPPSNQNKPFGKFSLTTEVTYFGCEKNTKSCIGQIYNSKPFYLYLEKHTPPCCIDKLKNVFQHVIEEFENVGIRYWLDNLALKNAIETNTLSLDAYEIDISFNFNDFNRSVILKKSQQRSYSDSKGYYWLKATDGYYFKVQYSKTNQIGINILPFNIIGEYVRPNGFYGWKAKDFSVEFLHPISTVSFLNKQILCPNNVRDYLELKNIY